jgi:hypothetical protein
VKLAVLGLVTLTLGGAAQPRSLAGCSLFPADNPWNQRVDSLPVAANSDTIIATIGSGVGLHPDFGSGKWAGGPIGDRDPLQRRHLDDEEGERQVRLRGRERPRPVPDPVEAEDRVRQRSSHPDPRLERVPALRAVRRPEEELGSGAIWSLNSNALRPDGWTSADAAGLPILPGLARWDEVAAGHIDHALRFTVQRTRRAYVYPARHYASALTDPGLPPMGLRVRLRADFDTGTFPPQARVVLEALKQYGMMVADNGSNWYISGTPDSHWDNEDLHTLGLVRGSDFEVVDPASIHP